MEKTSKKSSPRLQLIIAALIMSALFLAELYVMINESHNIVLVVGIAVLILIALYFVVDAVLDCMNEKDIANREQYDSIYRSEKASYMLMKKNLEELSKQVKALNEGNKNGGADSAEIIKAQKAIAKVTMSKSKETQDRLFIELNNLEASLNDSVHGLSEKLSGFQEEIERLADHIARINAEAIQEAAKGGQEVKQVVEEIDEVSLEDVLNETEISVENEVNEVAEESALDELMLDTEIGGFSDVEESTDELDFGDIDLSGLDLDASAPVESDDDILSQLLAAEEAPAAEPEPVPAPVNDNPNRMMTPEEIAALIAGANN